MSRLSVVPEPGRHLVGAGMSTKHTFGTLDALRGVAAVAVLIWHYDVPHQERYWIAGLAVDLFFVLSGFVIAHAYEDRLKSGWSPFRYLKTRMIRLWPLYILGTVIGLAAVVTRIAVTGEHAGLKYLAFCLAISTLLLPQMVRGWDAAFPFNGPAWSLFIEFVANILYGLGAFRLSNRSLLAVIAACSALTARVLFSGNMPVMFTGAGIAYALPEGVGTFATGVLLRRWWGSGALPRIAMPPGLVVLFFIGLLVLAAHIGSNTLAHFLAVTLVWPLVVVIGAQSPLTGSAERIFGHLGRMSYPLYATHSGFYAFASIAFGAGLVSHGLAFGSAVVLALVVADCADRFYDRPVRDWLSRR